MAVMRYVFGIPRSGSTLAYNLVRLLSGEPTEHTHSHIGRGDSVLPMVCTFRDFRDCAVSWWRRKDANGRELVGYGELLPRMQLIAEHIDYMESLRTTYAPDELVFIRYRRWVFHLHAYAEKLCLDLGLHVHEKDRDQVVALCSLPVMRQHTQEPDYKLGVDHIDDAAVGKWRRHVVPEDQERVTAFFARQLEAWRFEL